MKANANVSLQGESVILVPYEAKHVPKYHEWMKSEELRTLTASEPLSLDEEYEMQRKWREDEDKLTFIILARDSGLSDEVSSSTNTTVTNELDKYPMIGDVNLFLKGTPPSLQPTTKIPKEGEDEDEFEAEVEIMIAEQAYRRRGCAGEALRLMLAYATHRPDLWLSQSFLNRHKQFTTMYKSLEMPLPVPSESLVARVSDSNTPSIQLLEKLGFRVVKHVAVFSETEMRWVSPVESIR